MSDPAKGESSNRIDRIKAVLGLDEDKELAAICETQHPRISAWRNKGFHKTTALLLDALLDKYNEDCKPSKKRKKKRS